MVHTVQKQTFDLTLLMSRGNGMEFQQHISETFVNETIAIMDTILTNNSTEHETIRIDRLEIDVGNVSVNNFASDFSVLFAKKLQEQLTEKKVQLAYYQQMAFDKAKKERPSLAIEDTTIDSHVQYWELLTTFLAFGNIPWWASEQKFGTPDQWLAEVLVHQSVQLKTWLIAQAKAEQIGLRLIKQFSVENLVSIIQLFDAQFSKKVLVDWLRKNNVQKELAHLAVSDFVAIFCEIQVLLLIEQKTVNRENEVEIVLELFQKISDLHMAFSPAKQNKIQWFIKQFLSELPIIYSTPKEHRPTNDITPILNHLNITYVEWNVLLIRVKQTLQLPIEDLEQYILKIGFSQNFNQEKFSLAQMVDKFCEAIKEALREHSIFSSAHSTVPSRGNSVVSTSLPSTMSQENTHTAVLFDQKAPTEGYVTNAGLVLLSPYLPLVFNALGWSLNGKFTKKSYAFKAVFFLQYLVTAKTQTPEYFLLLNKILCGLPIQEPIPQKVRLAKKEKQEAKELLQEVIENWKSIKNTSVEGLQTSFLQREGKLTRKNDNAWHLQVERKSYDMLKDTIPWSFSIIKHDWMPEPLYVEW